MSRFNIAQAKARLSELVAMAMRGEEVVIARDNRPLVRLVPLEDARTPRHPGSAAGQVLYVAPDFDDTPDDFAPYR